MSETIMNSGIYGIVAGQSYLECIEECLLDNKCLKCVLHYYSVPTDITIQRINTFEGGDRFLNEDERVILSKILCYLVFRHIL